ncbi:hypothetical protein SDC9_146944 [bioreactor metagenome]|uniref:Uncharacterized protein n=1 Tax=bioreactor metagenome TaxID=1076179 RepID=A0A645ED31_9ZZZZ
MGGGQGRLRHHLDVGQDDQPLAFATDKDPVLLAQMAPHPPRQRRRQALQVVGVEVGEGVAVGQRDREQANHPAALQELAQKTQGGQFAGQAARFLLRQFIHFQHAGDGGDDAAAQGADQGKQHPANAVAPAEQDLFTGIDDIEEPAQDFDLAVTPAQQFVPGTDPALLPVGIGDSAGQRDGQFDEML